MMQAMVKKIVSNVSSLVIATAGAAVLFMTLALPVKAWAVWDYAGAIDTSWYTGKTSTYTITTASQLAGLSKLVEEGNSFEGVTITLGNSIDLSGNQWEPIGDPYTTDLAFRGSFDGNNHEITGLYIDNEESNQALFGTVVNATIKNLTVRGFVRGTVGASGIIAYASQSNLSNLTNYADVEATGNYSYKSTEKTYNGNAAGVVTYSVGMTDDGATFTYDHLVNYGNITCTASSGNGGVIGALMASDNNFFVVKNCYNYGDVYVSMSQNSEGLDDAVGGLLGTTSSFGTYTISNCGNEGNIFVNNNGSAGGLVGSIGGVNSVVENSYNTGSVTSMGTDFNAPTNATPTAAGLISYFASSGGSVSNNYSTGTVSSSSGYSAALVGAAEDSMESFAYNNYYLQGSSTGAFNDQTTGESWDSALAGESMTAEELAAQIDEETGVVKDPDISQYTFTEISEAAAEDESEILVPEQTITALEKVIVVLAALGLLVFGAAGEFGRFVRQRSGFGGKEIRHA